MMVRGKGSRGAGRGGEVDSDAQLEQGRWLAMASPVSFSEHCTELACWWSITHLHLAAHRFSRTTLCAAVPSVLNPSFILHRASCCCLLSRSSSSSSARPPSPRPIKSYRRPSLSSHSSSDENDDAVGSSSATAAAATVSGRTTGNSVASNRYLITTDHLAVITVSFISVDFNTAMSDLNSRMRSSESAQVSRKTTWLCDWKLTCKWLPAACCFCFQLRNKFPRNTHTIVLL